jgi:hypothetical protein
MGISTEMSHDMQGIGHRHLVTAIQRAGEAAPDQRLQRTEA